MTAQGEAQSQDILDSLLAAGMTAPPPTGLAVRDTNGRSVTWKEFTELAEHFTATLRANCAPGDRVIGLMPKDASSVALFVAALRIRVILVPLAEASPDRVVVESIRTYSPRMIFRDGVYATLDGVPSGYADEYNAQAAIILQTSGSTGSPKGVVVPRSCLANLASWGGTYYPIDNKYRFGIVPALHFAASLADLITALGTGSTLELIDGRGLLPGHLANELTERNVSHVTMVPSVLMMALGTGARSLMPTVMSLNIAGEMLPSALAISARGAISGDTHHLYACTETNVASALSLAHVDLEEYTTAPVGAQGIGQQVICLSTNSEIHVQGPGVMLGYWGAPPLQGDPRSFDSGDMATTCPDGYILQGRGDLLVKVRGKRIDLNHLERMAMQIQGVRMATAVASHGPLNELALVIEGHELKALEVRRYLSERLAPHLCPDRVVMLSTLPRNEHGKIDRTELANLIFSRTEGDVL